SRTESIEDDSLSESPAADAPIEDYASSDGEGDRAGKAAPPQRYPSPLTTSSPALTLGSIGSSTWGTPARPGFEQLAPGDWHPARVPLSPIAGNGGHAAGGSPAPSPASTRRRLQQAAPRVYTQGLPCSPLRTISSHRQNIGPQSAPAGRPLLSQRPSAPCLPVQPSAAASTPDSEPTPPKRPRRAGAAATEFLGAASREVSEFRMWQHCLSGDSDAQLVCHQPTPCVRLRLLAVQGTLGPHLFSAQADVLEVLADDHRLAQAAGRPIALLLSFAVFHDAAPQAAARVASRVETLAPAADCTPSGTSAPVVVAVYQPWRLQGAGDRLCLLASRFHIE
ncbi:hypothetical protein LPJ61_006355, partial [Coemansia biformis]